MNETTTASTMEAFETNRGRVMLGMRLQEKWAKQQHLYFDHVRDSPRSVLAEVCIQTGLLDTEAAIQANKQTLARLLASDSCPIDAELAELAALGLAFENGEIVAAPVIEYPPMGARD